MVNLDQNSILNKITCPVPVNQHTHVLLAHGSGGQLTRQLISDLIFPHLTNPLLENLNDSAVIPLGKNKIAFTTDAYVVSPLFFPGGSIGDLAVNGTVNDLAVTGADPLAISLSLILEEGCDLKVVESVIKAVAKASEIAGVPVATGDTKVVERGKCDQLYVITSGIGLIRQKLDLGLERIKPGDRILCNGSIGDHGISVMSARDNLEFVNTPKTDSAPLNHLIRALAESGLDIHFMRDPTRGGVASILNEISDSIGFDIELDEKNIPIHSAVTSACELLGLDPLHIANEGKVLIFVSEQDTDKALSIISNHPQGKESAIIGKVLSTKSARVVVNTNIGSQRLLHMLPGEQLPRIC